MNINFAAFNQKIAQLFAMLPSLGQLVQVAEVLLPNASGLTKAGFVINTVIAAEPALAGSEALLQTAVTNVVTAYKASGGIPAPVVPAAAPAAPAAPVPSAPGAAGASGAGAGSASPATSGTAS